MGEGHQLLNLYLQLNILLLMVWLIFRFSNRLAGMLDWDFSFQTQLKTARIVLTGVVLVPVILGVLSKVADLQFNDYLPVPARFVETAMAGLATGHTGAAANTLEKINSDRFLTGYSFLLIAGCLGFGLLVCRLLYKIKCLHQVIAGSYCWKRIGRIHILVSSDITIPFSTRLFGKSQIIVPETLFASADYLPVVIAHEGRHLRNGDASWEMIMQITGLLFYWNPAIYLWRSDLSRLQEYACDEAVLDKATISPRHYGNCLLHVAEQLYRSCFWPVASNAMAGINVFRRLSKSHLSTRIHMLGNKKGKLRSPRSLLAHRLATTASTAMLGILVAACAGVSTSTSITPPNIAPETAGTQQSGLRSIFPKIGAPEVTARELIDELNGIRPGKIIFSNYTVYSADAYAPYSPYSLEFYGYVAMEWPSPEKFAELAGFMKAVNQTDFFRNPRQSTPGLEVHDKALTFKVFIR